MIGERAASYVMTASSYADRAGGSKGSVLFDN